jgi:hypothetical protein
LVLELLTPALASELKLTTQRNLLEQYHLREEEVYRINREYRQTREIMSLDDLRDRKFGDIKTTVAYYTRMGTEAEQSAAAAIKYVLKPYRKGAGKGYVDNTAEMGKFVLDMSAPPFPEYIAMLNLTATLSDLETTNNNFRDLYEERSDDGLGRAEHENIKQLRRHFDATYRILTYVLPGAHFTESDALKKSSIASVIDGINAYLLQMRRILAARGMYESTRRPSAPAADSIGDVLPPAAPADATNNEAAANNSLDHTDPPIIININE